MIRLPTEAISTGWVSTPSAITIDQWQYHNLLGNVGIKLIPEVIYSMPEEKYQNVAVWSDIFMHENQVLDKVVKTEEMHNGHLFPCWNLSPNTYIIDTNINVHLPPDIVAKVIPLHKSITVAATITSPIYTHLDQTRVQFIMKVDRSIQLIEKTAIAELVFEKRFWIFPTRDAFDRQYSPSGSFV